MCSLHYCKRYKRKGVNLVQIASPLHSYLLPISPFICSVDLPAGITARVWVPGTAAAGPTSTSSTTTTGASSAEGAYYIYPRVTVAVVTASGPRKGDSGVTAPVPYGLLVDAHGRGDELLTTTSTPAATGAGRSTHSRGASVGLLESSSSSSSSSSSAGGPDMAAAERAARGILSVEYDAEAGYEGVVVTLAGGFGRTVLTAVRVEGPLSAFVADAADA